MDSVMTQVKGLEFFKIANILRNFFNLVLSKIQKLQISTFPEPLRERSQFIVKCGENLGILRFDFDWQHSHAFVIKIDNPVRVIHLRLSYKNLQFVKPFS